MRTIVVNDPRYSEPRLVLDLDDLDSPILMVSAKIAANKEAIEKAKTAALMENCKRTIDAQAIQGCKGCSRKLLRVGGV